MKRISLLTTLLIACAAVYAQAPEEKQAIKNLCGCYDVSFKYAETFAADTAYKFPARYKASGVEWVTMEESSDKKMVIQHLLLVDDSTIIKHWREDWEFEKNEWLVFDHDATWKKQTAPKEKVKGQWTQTVWEVDDAPRYQGTSLWVRNNGEFYWENTADAPLPRREYTKRKDYNVMQRTNRVIVSDKGWTHEQDNKKIIRKDGQPDVYVADEKGYNIYTKTSDQKCQAATAYWKNHRQFWIAVRQSWEDLIKDKPGIRLVPKAEGMLLYEQFDVLEKQALAGNALKEKIRSVMIKYIDKSESTQVAVK